MWFAGELLSWSEIAQKLMFMSGRKPPLGLPRVWSLHDLNHQVIGQAHS